MQDHRNAAAEMKRTNQAVSAIVTTAVSALIVVACLVGIVLLVRLI